MDTFEYDIMKIKDASPLELPFAIMQTELHDEKSAYLVYDEVSKTFEGEGIIDNVVTPVILTVVDGILAMKCFKGVARKGGLNAQRVMQECTSFNYDGKIGYLIPDSFVDSKNINEQQKLWAEKNRPKTEDGNSYIRELYGDLNAMNTYKKRRIEENGARVNMMDEYRNTRDISGTKATADKRRNDPKNEHNAETDHIIPLKTVFNQIQNNSALSTGDIKRIANMDDNFAITGRLVNNPKRDMSNSAFIKKQDLLKREGKPYIELDDMQRANMIRMENDAQKSINRCINETVSKNLTGKGQVDRFERKQAMEAKKKELGRKLTKEECQQVDRKLSKSKAQDIHMDNLHTAGKQSLGYLVGNISLLIIKPLYYEIKDIVMNGLANGVYVNSIKEAISFRFKRVKDYIMDYIKSMKDMLRFGVNMIKDLISALIEGIIGMFVGVFKKILRVIKEGIKIGMQTFSILFGENSRKLTKNEKGDAIIKVLGGSAVAICGIGINMLLEKIPALSEEGRSVISTLLSGLASILLFYALDSADLFNVKEEKRKQRIKEVFEMRIQDVKEKTSILTDSAAEAIRNNYIKSNSLLHDIKASADDDNYLELNKKLEEYSRFLFPMNKRTELNWDC